MQQNDDLEMIGVDDFRKQIENLEIKLKNLNESLEDKSIALIQQNNSNITEENQIQQLQKNIMQAEKQLNYQKLIFKPKIKSQLKTPQDHTKSLSKKLQHILQKIKMFDLEQKEQNNLNKKLNQKKIFYQQELRKLLAPKQKKDLQQLQNDLKKQSYIIDQQNQLIQNLIQNNNF